MRAHSKVRQLSRFLKKELVNFGSTSIKKLCLEDSNTNQKPGAEKPLCRSKCSMKSSKQKEPTLQPRNGNDSQRCWQSTARPWEPGQCLPWWVCQQSSWSRPIVVQMLSNCNDTKPANFKWRQFPAMALSPLPTEVDHRACAGKECFEPTRHLTCDWMHQWLSQFM